MYLQTKPMDVLYFTDHYNINKYIYIYYICTEAKCFGAKSFTTSFWHVFQLVTALKGHLLEGIDNGTLIQIRRVNPHTNILFWDNLSKP